MTKHSNVIDKILTSLSQYNLGQDPITDKPFTAEDCYSLYPELKEAKVALATELVRMMNEALGDKIDIELYLEKIPPFNGKKEVVKKYEALNEQLDQTRTRLTAIIERELS